MKRFESCGVTVVVGAGFAGAASALALARRGVKSVYVVEAESGPGHHASGRNAAMARRLVEEPSLARLAHQSLDALAALEARHGVSLLRPVGGLIIGAPEICHRLLSTAQELPGLSEGVRPLEGGDLARLVPALEGATSSAGLFSPSCGVVDIHGLLSAIVDEARALGVTFRYGTRVMDVGLRGGRVVSVGTDQGAIACDTIVNAAGHAASRIAALAGAGHLPMGPSRRHLYVTGPTKRVSGDAPYVWDVTEGFYFRPEGEGLLLCACDETPWPDGAPTVDACHREVLAETLVRHAPALRGLRPTHAWVGLRTLTEDGRFVLGRDAQVDGFVWAAGLGGHGMTTSLGVGELVADTILEGAPRDGYAKAFCPQRWSESPPGC